LRQEKAGESREKTLRSWRSRLFNNLGEDELDIPTFLRKQAD